METHRIQRCLELLRSGGAFTFQTRSEAGELVQAWEDEASYREKEQFEVVVKRIDQTEAWLVCLLPRAAE